VKHPKAVKIVGVGGIVVTALMTDWTGVALLVIAIILALCWVLDDQDRAKRLALLVSTWRHGTSTPQRRRAVTTPRRRAVTADPRTIEEPPATS
jgi:hypothetical protein